MFEFAELKSVMSLLEKESRGDNYDQDYGIRGFSPEPERRSLWPDEDAGTTQLRTEQPQKEHVRPSFGGIVHERDIVEDIVTPRISGGVIVQQRTSRIISTHYTPGEPSERRQLPPDEYSISNLRGGRIKQRPAFNNFPKPPSPPLTHKQVDHTWGTDLTFPEDIDDMRIRKTRRWAERAIIGRRPNGIPLHELELPEDDLIPPETPSKPKSNAVGVKVTPTAQSQTLAGTPTHSKDNSPIKAPTFEAVANTFPPLPLIVPAPKNLAVSPAPLVDTTPVSFPTTTLPPVRTVLPPPPGAINVGNSSSSSDYTQIDNPTPIDLRLDTRTQPQLNRPHASPYELPPLAPFTQIDRPPQTVPPFCPPFPIYPEQREQPPHKARREVPELAPVRTELAIRTKRQAQKSPSKDAFYAVAAMSTPTGPKSQTKKLPIDLQGANGLEGYSYEVMVPPPASTSRSSSETKESGSIPKKKYPCTIPGCDKSFTRKNDVQRHLKSTAAHRNLSDIDGDSPTRCKYCKRILSRNDSARRHELESACGKRTLRSEREGHSPAKDKPPNYDLKTGA